MNVRGLGEVTREDGCGDYCSQPVEVAALGGRPCRFVLDGYEADPDKEDYHQAIAAFLNSSPAVLEEAEAEVFRYYQDVSRCLSAADEEPLVVGSPAEVWAHVQFGEEVFVSRRDHGERGVYVSLECECDWEPEHGLQLVFKGGGRVSKVGPYDGHLTNADAFGDEALEHVVYRGAEWPEQEAQAAGPKRSSADAQERQADTKRRASWLGFVTLALLVAFGLVVAIGFAAELATDRGRPFDAVAWSDPARDRDDVRLGMADRLLADRALIGLTRAQVVAMLGEPAPTGYFRDWDLVYRLGMERSYISIDSEWLVLRLGPDGRVAQARLVRD